MQENCVQDGPTQNEISKSLFHYIMHKYFVILISQNFKVSSNVLFTLNQTTLLSVFMNILTKQLDTET